MPTALFQRVTQKIKKLTEVIRSTYGDNLVALIVFGSAARGDVHFGSDIDLLPVLEHAPKSQKDRWNELRHL
ncbi:MAG: nucleotidyltransferase domain-containing protein [Candidatus Atribacteria bacterium]|nr:nucleotidyltransferase domain-containing protein [Candidatus Atribacteria bacterium]